MTQSSPSPDELRSQLASLERSLAELPAAGVSEVVLAALRQQADAVKQLLVGAGVQAGQDVNVGGDVVRDKIGTQINTGGGPYIDGNLALTGTQAEECVRWSERNQRALDYFLGQLSSRPSDEDRLLETLERWGVLAHSVKGVCLTYEGALMFGPADKLPWNAHTDVRIDDRRYDPPRKKWLHGHCLLQLTEECSAILSELWEAKWEDPSRRDIGGRRIKVSAYPRQALYEALVNFIIHRDYSDDDQAAIVISDDYIEFVNPGASPYSSGTLLAVQEPLLPKYTRNKVIIRAFNRAGMNEREGGGIIRIRQALEANGNITPDGRVGLDIKNDSISNRFILVLRARPKGQIAKIASIETAKDEYLKTLVDRHSFIGLKGIGVSERVPLKLPLLEIYVPLTARPQLPVGETWLRGLRVAGRADLNNIELIRSGDLSSEPRSILGLLQRCSGLVILGDPGSGKTTFLKYLALRLAQGEGSALGLDTRLPVLVPLSDYAAALGKSDVRLDDFIASRFYDMGGDLPFSEVLDAALISGETLFLLDGLDEVKDLGLRNTVVERVIDFYTLHRRKGNKFVITSRVVGYQAVRPTADGLVECTLVDFDDDEIAAFVERWTVALERQAQGATPIAAADATRERRELLDAIHRNPSVHRLAANPLLLTILALMKRQGVTLPERRVELYDQYVTTLLSTWNRARGLGRSPSHDLDVVQTTRVLAPLALWMHEVNPGVGLVKREDLHRKLVALYAESGEPQTDRAARQFLDDVREYAGLLLERGPEEYGFIHLTFEEYLAAVGIVLAGQGDWRSIFERLVRHVGDPAWREVALLAVGYLGIRQQLPKVAGDVVEALAAEQPGAPGEAVVLAGEAVLDAWPGGVPQANRAKVVQMLVQTMQAAAVLNTLRRQSGLLLGRLGWLPPDLDDFVKVPAGEFLYGEDKLKQQIPYDFLVGKYPVTNVQYARFIDDQGYERQELWSATGWQWRLGEYDAVVGDDMEKKWLSRRPMSLRQYPFFWKNREWSNPIFPVVGVTWFEAEAYANWLNGRPDVLRLDEAMPQGYRVRLATEEEWECAARGKTGQEYPWLDNSDFANANMANETGEGIRTTAVCTYSTGVSPAGAWDMSGNIWEWMYSTWTKDEPSRVLRGGSWDNPWKDARCVARYPYIPYAFEDVIGFRVVVSLPLSSF